MKNAILFAPHNDDETLFAFYQMLRYRPRVVIVLRSFKQWSSNGPSYMLRESETMCAAQIAGAAELIQWPYSDLNPDWDLIAQDIYDALMHHQPEVVIAPAWEMGGHEDHNAVASFVAGIEADWHLIRYYTYERGYGRTRKGTEVEAEEGWRDLKLKALDCYRSQIARRDCAPWFPGGEYADTGEWIA